MIAGGLSEKEVEEYYNILGLKYTPNVLASKYDGGLIKNPSLLRKK